MRTIIALAALALAVGWSSRVLADDAWATNRFFGGGFDGYGAYSLIQNDTSVYNYVYARFTGGSFDGWGKGEASGLKIPLRGTIFVVR